MTDPAKSIAGFDAKDRTHNARVIGGLSGACRWGQLDRTLLWILVLVAVLRAPFLAVVGVILLRHFVRRGIVEAARRQFEAITRKYLDPEVQDIDC